MPPSKVLLIRHGARQPITGNNVWKQVLAQALTPWRRPQGCLTPLGYDQMTQLGQELHAVCGQYDTIQVAWSREASGRCKASAQALLRGLGCGTRVQPRRGVSAYLRADAKCATPVMESMAWSGPCFYANLAAAVPRLARALPPVDQAAAVAKFLFTTAHIARVHGVVPDTERARALMAIVDGMPPVVKAIAPDCAAAQSAGLQAAIAQDLRQGNTLTLYVCHDNTIVNLLIAMGHDHVPVLDFATAVCVEN